MTIFTLIDELKEGGTEISDKTEDCLKQIGAKKLKARIERKIRHAANIFKRNLFLWKITYKFEIEREKIEFRMKFHRHKGLTEITAKLPATR
jgi:hypothetical protein